MDSPETARLTSTLTTISATPPSESPPDSFSDFVNNLSPIEPGKKSEYAAQGFTGLESPPFVFSSPHLNANVESNLLKRTHHDQSSNTELVAKSQDYNSKVSEQTELCCPTELVDKFLADFEEVAGTSIIQDLSNKAEQNIEENLASEVCRPSKSEKEQSSTEFYSTEFDFSTSHAFEKQGNEDLFDQDACTVFQDCLDFIPQSFQEQFTNANSHGAYECNTKETLAGPFQPLSVDLPQPSMCQRYLQFKEATANAPQNNFHSSNFASNVKATSHYPSLVVDKELSVLNLDAAFNNRIPANSSHSVRTILHPDSWGNPPLGNSKPSGIGLHLNSIINVAIKNRGPIPGLGVQGVSYPIPKNENTFSGDVSFSAEEKKPSGIGLHLNSVINVAMKNHGPIASFGVQGLKRDVLSKNENTYSGNVSFSGHESNAISSTSSITLESCHDVKGDNFETPCVSETTNFDLDQSFNLEKIDNHRPKRKRKKSSVNSSDDDSKRCNCTKTKCLKLYCDCFAAGIYCPESCSCQGCFNNPENAHTVLETRHQIESRDPLAFAPKVTEDRNELAVNNENGSLSTPSLARHKKGCKCKKSMCLKQYCECYQANVGCTDRCRCKDCRNVHGKREEHCATPEPELASGSADVGRLEGRLISDHDATALRKHISHSEFYGQQPNFAPQTPSFQYSDHEKDSPKSRFMSRRCLPSPEFDSTSSSSPDCNDMFVETKTDMFDVDSYQLQQMNCDNGGTSSTSFIPSKPRGCINISRIGQPGIGSSSMLWRRSLDTPLIQAGKTSINCVDGSSPKKLVLPPHHSNENEVGMNNSLKSRRYILKSTSPFPPLTPRNE